MPTTRYSVTESAWQRIGTAPCVVRCTSVTPTALYVGTDAPSLGETAFSVLRSDDPDGDPVTAPGSGVWARALTGLSSCVVDTLGDGTLTGPLPAGENYLGRVGGNTRVRTGFLIRPNDTTPYVAGDLIGGSTTGGAAANVVTIQGVTRVPGGTGRLIRVRAATNQPTFAGTIRAHFFKTLVAPAVGDNSPLAASVPNYVNAYGPTEITLERGILQDGSKGYMAFSPPVAFDVPDGAMDIYAILEARTGFTPAAGQRFSLTLECDVD